MSLFNSDFTFFESLCEVRTAILNLVAANYIVNQGQDTNKLFTLVGEELGQAYDFDQELFSLSVDELLDLGFEFSTMDEELILVPLWLYPFIPRGTIMVDLDYEQFCVGDDEPEICDHYWVNFGFYPLTDEED